MRVFISKVKESDLKGRTIGVVQAGQVVACLKSLERDYWGNLTSVTIWVKKPQAFGDVFTITDVREALDLPSNLATVMARKAWRYAMRHQVK